MARMKYCLLIAMYVAVLYLRLFFIVIMNETLFKNMVSIHRMVYMYLFFILGGIAALVAAESF